MPTDKEIKKEFKRTASENHDKYYATNVLKKSGFKRKHCDCGIYYWTSTDSKTCGDSACSGGFRFFENNPCSEKLSYIDVWKKFSIMFSTLGYTPIKRYPLVARWRDDMDFTIASIAAFQPYVVSGEVEAPANPLVIPQFCLRFGDIDNVGITGAHMTCFNMIGQHMFVSPDKWNQEKVFSDIKKWLNDGLGLLDSEIIFHEDAWAGGGNFGPCMEFFSRGVEIGNQVYMMYEQTPSGQEELKLKVLDMGMGMERNAWFSQGVPTIYDATFPAVMKKLRERTNISVDEKIIKKYVPYAGYLNIDEVDDIQKAWQRVSDKVGIDVLKLKEIVLPNAALYSIAEHARGLLIAFSDGALASNVGGGYNLRVLARRAFSFIDQYKWDIDLADVCAWHAEELKEIFPELQENLQEVRDIINVEKRKYESTKDRANALVLQMIKKGDITEDVLIELYDSNGITPDIIKSEAKKSGIEVVVPDDFYIKVSARHEKKAQVHQTKLDEKILIPEGTPDTVALYYDDYSKIEFQGHVLYVNGDAVVLDKTVFYPTSGGQLHDIGTLNHVEVYNVIKQGPYIIHFVKDSSSFKKGDSVTGKIDFVRRKQLAQHHTSTHIVNAAAKKVLGNHVYQAGAKKTKEKAHLDITHFESLTEQQVNDIEEEANWVIQQDLVVNSNFLLRAEAEKKYGMKIYQGGAVPGKKLRIIDVDGVDVEACGGTHLRRTGEAVSIKILKTSKISDSIIRIEFVAGDASSAVENAKDDVLNAVSEMLGIDKLKIPARSQEIFEKWKKAKSAIKKQKEVNIEEFELTSDENFEGDVLKETARILQTQEEHVPKTIQRFLKELEDMKKKMVQ